MSAAILVIGRSHPFSPLFLGTEVLLTILSLFIFGSTKYQLDKNALTYGAGLVIASTFFTMWWPLSYLRIAMTNEGMPALWDFVSHYAFSLHGLDELVHADTMLFILGLTYFVCAIAQTRMLESISFRVLRRNSGAVFPTIAFLTAIVSFSSGILDGVSMIGLLIRTMVIILVLAKADDVAIKFAVIVSTVITTVCGMWLAYGEPPNLIMKANLHPYLTNGFFLRYCLPTAVGTYFIVLWNVRKHLSGHKVDVTKLPYDTIDDNHRRSQKVAVWSFLPFIGLLIYHGINHKFPLFWASFAGFAVAFSGIYAYPHMRQRALHEAKHEYMEYLFLFPLFLSITLLQKSGFFDSMSALLHSGIEKLGVATIAYIQYAGAVVLSALLDNNVVADFASRALHGLEISVLHLFSMAQIAGYAAGGCWTHIGSAQSVVAFAFIRRDVDKNFSPFQWIKMMTPVIIQISIFMIVVIYGEALLASILH